MLPYLKPEEVLETHAVARRPIAVKCKPDVGFGKIHELAHRGEEKSALRRKRGGSQVRLELHLRAYQGPCLRNIVVYSSGRAEYMSHSCGLLRVSAREYTALSRCISS